jgi:hypothetical protein
MPATGREVSLGKTWGRANSRSPGSSISAQGRSPVVVNPTRTPSSPSCCTATLKNSFSLPVRIRHFNCGTIEARKTALLLVKYTNITVRDVVDSAEQGVRRFGEAAGDWRMRSQTVHLQQHVLFNKLIEEGGLIASGSMSAYRSQCSFAVAKPPFYCRHVVDLFGTKNAFIAPQSECPPTTS